MLELYGTIFQVGSGILLLIIGSRLIAMEYSSGTIRIAYARAWGGSNSCWRSWACSLSSGLRCAGYILVVGAIATGLYASYTGGWPASTTWCFLGGLQILAPGPGDQHVGRHLLAAAAAGLGRALAFAMAASLAFFPVDNFLVGIMH